MMTMIMTRTRMVRVTAMMTESGMLSSRCCCRITPVEKRKSNWSTFNLLVEINYISDKCTCKVVIGTIYISNQMRKHCFGRTDYFQEDAQCPSHNIYIHTHI